MGTQILTDAQNAIVSWRRVIGILETPADLVDPGPDAQQLPRGPIDVTLDDVSFAYPGGPDVLREVSMHIDAGTRVAIVGETGSGKSTVAKLLTRLMDPRSGAVLLDGIDVRSIAPHSLRKSVVLVPQEGFLFDDSIAANVATASSTPPNRRSWAPRTSWDSATGSTASRAASTPWSASAASHSPPASVSSWPCCARTSRTPTCWCWMRRPVPSTRTSRCRSDAPWSG
jgi:hypothetical protein